MPKTINKKYFYATIVTSSLMILFATLYLYEKASSDSDTNKTTAIPEVNDLVTDIEAVDPSDHIELTNIISENPTPQLSKAEIDGLLLMREEEKLAHDVYTTLYDYWGQKIFKNISMSEQTHTDTVKVLLDKYGIEDPVTDNEVGVFESEQMQDLYVTLVGEGKESLIEGLKIGALVEDLDIKDLTELMTQTENEDLLIVYQNLLKGSRNHIRAFTRLIERNGDNYEPLYISTDEYNSIVSGPSENGVVYDSSRKPL